jgi:hypothetical protein
MRIRVLLVAALGLALASCAGFRHKGNDTGGIIAWSPENEQMALQLAQQNCGWFRKYAVITSVVRGYGNYIAYDCRLNPPQRG